ncbi:MAG: T9SS type A sorting domain-containing protein [Cytophagales bacterium]|nr:T9SS type A sorting domain-containing protein [Cytophagales bacterium]
MRISTLFRPLLLLGLVSPGLVPALQAQNRDPLRWPFAKTSIWNMPIHRDAVYVPAGIGAPVQGTLVDEDYIVLTPNATSVPIYENNAGWDRSKDRCLVEGGALFQAPIPGNFVISRETWLGDTPNAGLAVLMPDGRTIKQTQPFARCTAGGNGTSKYVFPDTDLYGEGIRGAHGGSGLSAIGGTLRLGELVPGGTIRHALKVNVYAARYLAYNDTHKGYRWPAVQADGYAANVYGGPVEATRMGALLALPPSVDLNAMGLETEPGRIIARAMQDYGAYIVDDPYWDVTALITEFSPQGRVIDEFKSVWGMPMEVYGPASTSAWSRDMARIFTSLHVVDNNGPATIGGGPTTDLVNRRAPAAPDFVPSRTLKIMPLGDSKTEGGGGGGQQSSWRGFLRTDLLKAGYKIDYVGPRQNYADGDTEPYDRDHAGHGGYTIGPDTQKFCSTCETTGLFENLDKWFTAANPDIVLLSIGVNDFFNDANHPANYRSTAPQRYQDLVNKILSLKPGVKIVVGTVEPVKWDRNWGGPGTDLGNLNARIREIANASATDNVYLADVREGMLAGYSAADFFDDVHLSAQGATKAANVWLEALVPVLNSTPDNAAPSVSLTSPAPNAVFTAPASITLEVAAEDADGTVSKVEFYNGNTKIGEATAAPFSFTWNHVDEGTYLLRAVAVDNLFARTSSATHTVTVNASDGYVPFTGTGIGSPGSYDNNGKTFAMALDGNLETYFDGPGANGQWVGLDLGLAKRVKKVRYASRPNWESRMNGAKIQGANSPDFSDATDLCTLTGAPVAGFYTVSRFENAGLYQYYRFLSPNGGYGNVAEIEFWGDPADPVTQPPAVGLTTPVANAMYAPGATIHLAATATDPDGTVTRVDFYRGGTLLGTATAAPFGLTWPNVPAGTYSLVAKATDNLGVVKASAPAVIVVNTTASEVLYAENFNANTAAGWVVNSGTFTARNQRYESSSNGEFSAYYDGRSFSNYTYRLNALANWNNDIGFLFNYVDAGNHYLLVVNAHTKRADLKKRVNGVLSTLATAPFTGQGPGGTNHFEISHTGSATTVRINGTVVFAGVPTAEFPGGRIGLWTFYNPSHFDNIQVTSNNQLPTVSLTAPAAHALFDSPVTVELAADAADADGTVSRVDFYDGATLLGTATESPYTFAWTGVAPGTYYLTAKATDNAGSSAFSSVVPVTVEPSGGGLSATYYNDKKPKWEPVLTRTDPVVDFNWGTGPAGAGVNTDKFFVRWSGRVKPRYSETYTFHTQTDGSVRLWVNGVLLLENKYEDGVREHQGTIALAAGVLYDLVMEYVEEKDNAVARLLWSSSSQAKGVIPQARLFAPAPGGAAARRSAESPWAGTGRGISLYPNPSANGEVSVRMTDFAAGQPVRVAVRDLSGRVVYAGTLPADAAGRGTLRLGRTPLRSGVYLVTVASDGAVHTLKLVVQP